MSRAYGEPDAEWFPLLGRSNSAVHRDGGADALDRPPFRTLVLSQFVVKPLMIPLAMIVSRAVLRTFCTFLRELSSQPPHRFGGVEAAEADA